MNLAYKSIILNLFLCLSTFQLSAQSIDLSSRFSFSLKDTQPSAVLSHLRSVSSIPFTFISERINLDRKISFEANNERIDTILNRFCRSLHLEYSIYKGAVSVRASASLLQAYRSGQFKQKFTISGSLKDSSTKELLIGATVYIPEIEGGTVSNEYGFYSITLKQNKYTLIIRCLGYKTKEVTIDLSQNINIDYELKAAFSSLEPIIVYSPDFYGKKGINSPKFTQTLDYLPSALGEAELLKSIDNISGISSEGQGSVFFHVRGGNKDQNLILLDEAPIYNPAHLAGFFSSFCPDAIKEVNVYKSGIPVKFGGRLSSILDIRTKNGSLEKWSGYLSSNPFATTASIEGPLINNKMGIYLSARRSTIQPYISYNYSDLLRANFNDINLKWHYKINNRNRLYLTIYRGVDFIGLKADTLFNPSTLFNAAKIQQYTSAGKTSGLAAGWKNRSLTLRWNRIIKNKLFSNTTLYFSNYDYRIKIGENNLNELFVWQQDIYNGTLKQDYTFYQTPFNHYSFGVELKTHLINPGNLYGNWKEIIDFYPSISKNQIEHFVLYFGSKRKIKKHYELYYGVRYNNWKNTGPTQAYYYDENYNILIERNFNPGFVYNTFNEFEPRAYLKRTLNERIGFQFSYDRTTQFLNLLNNSISPFTNLDFWLPANHNISPQKADQFTLAWYHYTKAKKYFFAIETFNRLLYNQIDFIDHPQLLLNPFIESQFRTGKGKSYGLELTAEKLLGRFRGLLTYNYIRTYRTIPEINYGNQYAPYFDRPHDLNLSLHYILNKRWEFATNFTLSSGYRYTSPTSFYEYNGQLIPVFTVKNNDRLPNFHQLDISIKYHFKTKLNAGFEHYLNLGVINIYNQKNIFNINSMMYAQNPRYDAYPNNEIEYIIPLNTTQNYNRLSTANYLLGTVPSITYTLKIN